MYQQEITRQNTATTTELLSFKGRPLPYIENIECIVGLCDDDDDEQ